MKNSRYAYFISHTTEEKQLKKKMIICIVCLLLLPFLNPSIPTSAKKASYDVATTNNIVKVYAKPGTSYTVVGKLKKNVSIKVIGAVAMGSDQKHYYSAKMFGFSKITYKGKTRYIKTSELKFKNPKQWSPGVKEAFEKEVVREFKQEKIPYKFVYIGHSNYTFKIKQGKRWLDYVTIDCKTGKYHG